MSVHLARKNCFVFSLSVLCVVGRPVVLCVYWRVLFVKTVVFRGLCISDELRNETSSMLYNCRVWLTSRPGFLRTTGRAVWVAVSMSYNSALTDVNRATSETGNVLWSWPAWWVRWDCVTHPQMFVVDDVADCSGCMMLNDVMMWTAVLSHMPPTSSHLSSALYSAPHPGPLSAAEAGRQVMTHHNDTSLGRLQRVRPTTYFSWTTFMCCLQSLTPQMCCKTFCRFVSEILA